MLTRKSIGGASLGLAIVIAFLAVRVVEADGRDDRQLLLVVLLFTITLAGLLVFSISQQWAQQKEARALRLESDQNNLVTDELTHRVKNMLTVVQSLVVQTAASLSKKAETQEAREAIQLFQRGIESRILALSETSNLIVRGTSSVMLREIIRSTLRPLADMTRFDIDGPEVSLAPNTAVMTNLLFHELATNAIKYGSLSNDEGWVELHWVDKGDCICFTWRERSGPPVSPPTTFGFGSKLVRRAAMRDLGGNSEMVFERTGLLCHIEIPLSHKVALVSRKVRART